MREHQIVITLKPDQFLEVQRLARAANAKSMGAFVRQKLLAALGIEGVVIEEATTQSNAVAQDVDIEAVLNDLKRVHADLKTFVAESLSPYSPEAFGQVEQADPQFAMVSPVVVEQAAVDEQAHLSDEQQTLENDELEKLADRTFAISPRLGPIGDPASTQQLQNQLAQQLQQQPPNTSRDDSRILLSRTELHSRRDTHRYQHSNGPLDSLDEPFTPDQPEQPIATNILEDIAAEEHFDDAPPVVPSRPLMPHGLPSAPAVDPLSKLLSHEDMMARNIPRTQPLDEDDDAFDVPLSISERRRLLEDGDEQPVYSEPPHPALQPTLPSEMPLDTPAPAPSAAPITNELSSSPPAEAPMPETPIPQASPAPVPPATDPGAPLGYPPLSGSPPPKRRQL